MSRRSLGCVLIIAAVSAASQGAVTQTAAQTAQIQPIAGAIWIEGEDATSSTFNNHNWYSTSGIHQSWLSPGSPEPPERAGEWLSHYSETGVTAEATYNFRVVSSLPHTIWMRTSVYRVRQWYSLDGGPRAYIDMESDPRERFNLTHPALDIRFLAWIRVADVELAAGAHELTVGVEAHPAWAPTQSHAGIDAISIVPGRWFPAGTIRPDRPLPGAGGPGEWYPFVAEDDPFVEGSATDMSEMLHTPAGARGPLHRSGDGLAFDDGTPARFWGVGASIPDTDELMARQAQWYARNGVNLVRLHPVEADIGLLRPAAGGARELDPARLDRLDRWFSALAERGIYMAWSPFYPHVVTAADGIPAPLLAELPDIGGGKSSSGMVAFVPELQEAEWEWLSTLMAHRNPYNGQRYVDSPALAILEVHNEDSIFWHFPLNDLAGGEYPAHLALLQREWAAWLRGRYASDAALRAAWGPPGSGSKPEDSLANEAMVIYGAWEMEADGPFFNKSETRRMGDFIRFLAETQRSYYQERGRRLREMGFQGVLVTTAWMAGGPAARAANVWSDDALDMIDRHGYFGGGQGVHRIIAGDVNNGTHLAQPGTGILSAGFEQVEDKPFVMSEWNQNPPNQWKAEIAPLMAFYGMGLQGWDALIHFHGGAAHYDGGWPRLDSYVTETPHFMGQFPVLARAVHRGDLRVGDVAAARRLSLDDAFAGVDGLTQPTSGGGFGPPNPSDDLDTPPEAFAIGRVTQKTADGQPASQRADWDAYWDRTTGVITSSTGELEWDTQRSVVRIRSAQTQGVIGFAGGTRQDLPDLTITVSDASPFISLLVTSLDDLPLDRSARILVSALARDRQSGALYSEDGSQLLDVGAPPLLLEPVQARVRFTVGMISEVRRLDQNGLRGEPADFTADELVLSGADRTWLFEVTRSGGRVTPEPTATATTGLTPTPSGQVIHLPALLKDGRAR